jgi:thiol-disulfide isomerase/thioredoxin
VRRLCALLLLAGGPLLAQSTAAEKEDKALDEALAEAAGSPVEYARILERHLKLYPESPRRAEIERVLAMAAIDLKDKRRAIAFGAPLLDAGSNDVQLLEYVTRALLDREDKEWNERALGYSLRLQTELAGRLKSLREEREPGTGRRLDELTAQLGRAQTFEARALGNLGKLAEAAARAKLAAETYPSAEASREAARWLERQQDWAGAALWLAEAFAMGDARANATQRAADRARLKELWLKAKGSEEGLGESLLAAYDRTAARVNTQQRAVREWDPNAFASQPMEFTLSGLKGERIELASLKGKVAVLDFWATWCGPCRVQYPLYQQVERTFNGTKDVVFLAVSTDEDRSAVAPFLATQKWSKNVYFDDGLATLLRVSSIPTTIVVGRDGQITSRLTGFTADRFVDMLTLRIREALDAR